MSPARGGFLFLKMATWVGVMKIQNYWPWLLSLHLDFSGYPANILNWCLSINGLFLRLRRRFVL